MTNPTFVPTTRLKRGALSRLANRLAEAAGVSAQVATDCLMGNFTAGDKMIGRDVNLGLHRIGARKMGGLVMVPVRR